MDIACSRQDFWTTTKYKQLNFIQHVFTLLDVGGRCVIVVPDNVLFEGGAGETVRRRLLRQAEEIADDLQAVLEKFATIAADLRDRE